MSDLNTLSTEELMVELANRIDAGHERTPLVFSKDIAEKFRKADVITISDQEFQLGNVKRLLDAFSEAGVSDDKLIRFISDFKGT